MTNNETKSEPAAGGLSDVSQLLRRQAEELSRLSQQLSGAAPSAGTAVPVDRTPSAEKPPVQTWMPPGKPPFAAVGGGESHLPVLASDPALSADSLPVLDAFRQFLDEERRRTRRRMIRLMAGGAVIILGIMAVVAWGIDRSIRQTRHELQITQQKTSQLATAQADQVGKVSLTASNLERRISYERLKVQSVATNLQKMVEAEKQRSDQVLNRTAATMTDQQEEIQRLKEMIATLEIDNALLMGSIKELKGEGDAAPQQPGLPVGLNRAEEFPLPDGAWIAPLPEPSMAPSPAYETLPGARVPVRLPKP